MIQLASGRRISKQTLFLVLHLGGWSLLMLVVAAWEGAIWGFGAATVMDAIYCLGGIAVCFPLRGAFRLARRAKWSYLSLAVLAVMAAAIVSPLWWVIDHWLDNVVFEALAGWFPASSFKRLLQALNSQGYSVSPAGWLINTLSLLTWSTLYIGINAVLDLEAEKARTEQALKLADSAKLQALQSQLNPHFIFNTLNGISTLIREGDAAAAGSMIATLSEFLRLTLARGNSPEITVADELMFIERYLRIQKLRFGSRLRATVEAAPDTARARIPTLLLQPLVENAVRHGILGREQGGDVHIQVRRSGDALKVSVEDDGGSGPPKDLKFGVGLSNTSERLAALYGAEARLDIEQGERGGYRVTVTLPFSADLDPQPEPAIRTGVQPA